MMDKGDWVVVATDRHCRGHDIGARGVITETDTDTRDPWPRVLWEDGLCYRFPEYDLERLGLRPVVYGQNADGTFGLAQVELCHDVPQFDLTDSDGDLRRRVLELQRNVAGYGVKRRYWLAVPVGTCFHYEEIMKHEHYRQREVVHGIDYLDIRDEGDDGDDAEPCTLGKARAQTAGGVASQTHAARPAPLKQLIEVRKVRSCGRTNLTLATDLVNASAYEGGGWNLFIGSRHTRLPDGTSEEAVVRELATQLRDRLFELAEAAERLCIEGDSK